MNTKIAVILTVLVMLVVIMAGFLLKDFITIGKSEGDEELVAELLEEAVTEAGVTNTTAEAGGTTGAGTTAVGTTAAPTTTVTGATATTAAATTAPTTKAATTTTTAAIGNLVTTTTTQGMGVLVTTTAAGKPDLVILPGGAGVSMPMVKAGETVTLSGWTVKNDGTAASGSFKNGFYISDNPVITAGSRYLTGNSNLSLAPGEQYTWGSSTLTVPSDLNAGIYYIGVLVDRENEVNESIENNNYISREIVVTN